MSDKLIRTIFVKEGFLFSQTKWLTDPIKRVMTVAVSSEGQPIDYNPDLEDSISCQYFCIDVDPETISYDHIRFIQRMPGLVSLALHLDSYSFGFDYSHLSDRTRRWLEIIDDYLQYPDVDYPGNTGSTAEEKERIAQAIELYGKNNRA